MKKRVLLFSMLLLTVFSSIQAQTWNSVGGTQGFDGGVYALLADDANNVLYAGGIFKTVDGVTVNGIAKWDGTKWSALGTGFTSTNAVVFALAIYKNELYAGGYFTQAGSTAARGIAKWDGSKWIEVGGGISTSGFFDFVGTMQVFNGELYVGGEFSSVGSLFTDNVAKWDGSTWSAVGGGVQAGSSGRVNSLHIHNNELYISGHFFADVTSSNLQYRIAKLSGNAWVNVGNIGLGDATDDWNVRAITTYKGALYAGGRFNVLEKGTTVANHIAKWDGNAWAVIGTAPGVGVTPFPATFPPVRALAAYDGKLYFGGNFNSAGGVQTTNLATWDGNKIEAVAGSAIKGEITSMTVFNGSLIIGGNFTEAGGSARNRIAMLNTPNNIKDDLSGIDASVVPNPFSHSTILTLNTKTRIDIVRCNIHDGTGRVVKTIDEINGNTIKINRTNLTPGVYYYSVQGNEGVISTGRLLVQ